MDATGKPTPIYYAMTNEMLLDCNKKYSEYLKRRDTTAELLVEKYPLAIKRCAYSDPMKEEIARQYRAYASEFELLNYPDLYAFKKYVFCTTYPLYSERAEDLLAEVAAICKKNNIKELFVKQLIYTSTLYGAQSWYVHVDGGRCFLERVEPDDISQ